jgi:glycosyltransferase involved in cell wall biosynthesis
MHYALPLALQRAGLLDRVFTEFYAPPGSAEAWTARLTGLIRPPLARRLLLRYHPELETGRVVRNPWLVLPEQVVRSVSPTPEDYFRRASQLVGRWVQRAGWGRSNVLVGFIRNIDPRLCRYARGRGLVVVGDQIIAPAAVEHREAAIQHARFPGWEPSPNLLNVQRLEQETWAAVHHITAPSEYVRDGLVGEGVAPEKVSVLPYPAEAEWFRYVERPPNRRPLTVGFVGQVCLRKGAPYFFQMARRFDPAAVHFVMVGPVHLYPQTVARHAGAVQVVGGQSRKEVGAWMERFDVLYFPSTCEGSVGAVMEAMMCGLPVVATPNSGTVIRHGTDGFLTAYDDLDAAHAHLERLVRDPDLRLHIGRAAHERACEFDLAAYSRMLADLVTRLRAAPDLNGPPRCAS